MSKQKVRVLGAFSLAMISMAAIVSLRNLSLIAGLGLSAVFFLSLAALIFFIPISLVVAELAAAWPKPGGCYEWVKEAFGKPLAFITLWLSLDGKRGLVPNHISFYCFYVCAHVRTAIPKFRI